ncbi:Glycosyltransferase 2-like domain-containing protein OS=Streptomyces fumanus OX=67302 GN=GCM10018772_45660 PE=3 SV=1 [Streptomyces fumanus]
MPAEVGYRWVTDRGAMPGRGWETLSFPEGGARTREDTVTVTKGFQACTGDIIVMVDADGSADGQEILSYVSALVSGADFAKGSRFANGGGTDDMTFVRKLGNRVLCAAVNRKFGARYTDLCYGYNAFWRHCLDKIDLDCTGFEVETLMNIRVVKAGLRVQEIPSHEYLRIHGVSNLRAVRDGLRVLRVILQERSNRRALRGRTHPAAPGAVRGRAS